MTALFVLLAVALALGTAGLLLRPLMREDAEAPQRPMHYQYAIGLVMLVLGATPVLYLAVGSPDGLRPATAAASPALAQPGGEAPDMQTAMAQLGQRLREQPNDLTGWMLLGRSHRAMQNFAASLEAFQRAFALAPEEPDVMVDYAEALVLASSSRRFEGEAQSLLEQALQINARHERGLLLLGVSHMQRDEHAQAAEAWERLAALLPPDSDALRPLRERIAEARAAAGMPPAAPTAPVPAEPALPEPPGSGGLVVRVDLDPSLQSRVAPGAALFVFVRDPEGSPAPVAVRRLPADRFPLMVRLTDADRMVPGTSLSALPRLRLAARISQTGNAAPAPGDLEAGALDIAPDSGQELRLHIDRQR